MTDRYLPRMPVKAVPLETDTPTSKSVLWLTL